MPIGAVLAKVRKEGRFWEITYRTADGAKQPGALELVRNYENAFKKNGGAWKLESQGLQDWSVPKVGVTPSMPGRIFAGTRGDGIIVFLLRHGVGRNQRRVTFFEQFRGDGLRLGAFERRLGGFELGAVTAGVDLEQRLQGGVRGRGRLPHHG